MLPAHAVLQLTICPTKIFAHRGTSSRLRAPERVPGGPVGGVRLGLPRRGGGAAEGVGGVVVAAQLAVAGHDPGPAFPVAAGGVVGIGDGTEGLDGPRGRLLRHRPPEFGRPGFGRMGEAGEVGIPIGAAGVGQPLRPGVALGVEPAGAAVGDPRDQDVGGVVRPGQGAVGDGGGEDLAGVDPGQLGAAQDPAEGGGAVLGGELGTLSVGQGAGGGGGEFVESAGGAGGDGLGGDVGKALAVGLHAGRGGGVVGGDRGRGLPGDRIAVGEDPGEQRERVAVQGLVGPALGGVVDGAGGGDVGGVRITSAGQCDVQRRQ